MKLNRFNTQDKDVFESVENKFLSSFEDNDEGYESELSTYELIKNPNISILTKN